MLPKENEDWPLRAYEEGFDAIDEWADWWAGTASRFQNYYSAGQSTQQRGPRTRWGKLKDGFFGTEKGNEQGVAKASPSSSSVTIHLPVAGACIRMNAALMYSYPPLFKPADTDDSVPADMAVEETPTPPAIDPTDPLAPPPEPKPEEPVVQPSDPSQERLDELVNGDVFGALLMAHGESTGALGGGVLRVVWDDEVDPTGPWIEHLDADACIPEFTWGRLRAITFWTEHKKGDDTVWRHFEEYKRGMIEHALYEGSKTNVGRRVPLTECPATADLANSLVLIAPGVPGEAPEALDPAVLMEGVENGEDIEFVVGELTGYDGIAAVYIPNRTPNPQWRKDPQLKNWGMSDLSPDVLPLLAAADEVWSSLMRDVRQGKGRLVISESLLQTLGGGKGSWLDTESEYIEKVSDTLEADAKPVIEQVQFQIREGAHLAVLEAIMREVLRRIGISPMTYGLTEGVVATTATEVRAHKADSITTVLAKRRLATPNLAGVVEALMAIDQMHFAGPGLEGGVDVHWPAEVQISDEEKARVISLMADALSTYEKVKYFHDDWDEIQIQTELKRLKNDTPAPPVMDPFGFGNPAVDENKDAPEDDDDAAKPPAKQPAFGA